MEEASTPETLTSRKKGIFEDISPFQKVEESTETCTTPRNLDMRRKSRIALDAVTKMAQEVTQFEMANDVEERDISLVASLVYSTPLHSYRERESSDDTDWVDVVKDGPMKMSTTPGSFLRRKAGRKSRWGSDGGYSRRSSISWWTNNKSRAPKKLQKLAHFKAYLNVFVSLIFSCLHVHQISGFYHGYKAIFLKTEAADSAINMSSRYYTQAEKNTFFEEVNARGSLFWLYKQPPDASMITVPYAYSEVPWGDDTAEYTPIHY